ncbi:Flagellin [Escherichia coli]|nr:Flagellin [Escherichia coli]
MVDNLNDTGKPSLYTQKENFMAQVINTNSLSLLTQNNLNKSQSSLSSAIERLSSGLRINSRERRCWLVRRLLTVSLPTLKA